MSLRDKLRCNGGKHNKVLAMLRVSRADFEHVEHRNQAVDNERIEHRAPRLLGTKSSTDLILDASPLDEALHDLYNIRQQTARPCSPAPRQ